jgi:hypothetical protein
MKKADTGIASEAETGFVYAVELVRPDGSVKDREVIHNLQPVEALDHMMGVVFKGAVQASTWYIGLFEGNYVPTPSAKAATIAADATECTAYTPANRVEFVEGASVNGAIDNSATKAEFTFTANKTIYGAFMASSSPHGSTTGVLMSVVRFASPKVVELGDVLRVTAGNSLISV